MKNEMAPVTGRGSVWDFMSDMEKAFEDLWSDSSHLPTRRETRTFTPAVDLQETNDSYLLSVDVPGVSEKDIQIEAQDGRLIIKGERKSEHKAEEDGYRRIEKSYGHFERSFQLPNGVTEDKIQAHYKNGVLEVMIPKSAHSKPRSIQIDSTRH